MCARAHSWARPWLNAQRIKRERKKRNTKLSFSFEYSYLIYVVSFFLCFSADRIAFSLFLYISCRIHCVLSAGTSTLIFCIFILFVVDGNDDDDDRFAVNIFTFCSFIWSFISRHIFFDIIIIFLTWFFLCDSLFVDFFAPKILCVCFALLRCWTNCYANRCLIGPPKTEQTKNLVFSFSCQIGQIKSTFQINRATFGLK